MEEISPEGHLVKSVAFPQASYTISTSIDSQQNQIFQFTNNITSSSLQVRYRQSRLFILNNVLDCPLSI